MQDGTNADARWRRAALDAREEEESGSELGESSESDKEDEEKEDSRQPKAQSSSLNLMLPCCATPLGSLASLLI